MKKHLLPTTIILGATLIIIVSLILYMQPAKFVATGILQETKGGAYVGSVFIDEDILPDSIGQYIGKNVEITGTIKNSTKPASDPDGAQIQYREGEYMTKLTSIRIVQK